MIHCICIQVTPSAITVTIELDWNVTSVGKPVPSPYTAKVSEGTVLVNILNKAADENSTSPFNKYTSTYYGGQGHYITSMNGIKEVRVQNINFPKNVTHTFHRCSCIKVAKAKRK